MSLEQRTIPGLNDGIQEFRGVRRAFCISFEKYYWDFVRVSRIDVTLNMLLKSSEIV